EVGDRAVTTIEGLSGDAVAGAVRREAVEGRAFQCGYCAPGMVIGAAAMLRDEPAPDDERIRRAMEPNVCRCCSYPAILRAIRSAGESLAHASATTSTSHRTRSGSEPPELARPTIPWDLTRADERDWFGVLGDGLVVVLSDEDVPPWIWSASGG